MEARDRGRAVIPRCHECGKPVFSKRELVYHHIRFGEASLWGERLQRDMIHPRPFHRVCWRIRRRREMVGWIVALGILLALVLGPVLINLLG